MQMGVQKEFDKNRKVKRNKMILVGYGAQEEGINYKETFYPVIKSKCIMILLVFVN